MSFIFKHHNYQISKYVQQHTEPIPPEPEGTCIIIVVYFPQTFIDGWIQQ